MLSLLAALGLLKTASLLATEISTLQMYQLLFPYISWDEYHQTPIFLW